MFYAVQGLAPFEEPELHYGRAAQDALEQAARSVGFDDIRLQFEPPHRPSCARARAPAESGLKTCSIRGIQHHGRPTSDRASMTVTGRFHRLRQWLALALVAMASPLWAATQVLYDRSVAPLDSAYVPTVPVWLSAGFFGLGQTVTAAGTEVTPSALFGESASGGYSNHTSTITFPPLQVNTGPMVNAAFPSLRQNSGYSLSLGFRVTNETHSGNTNRAGFSVTLIGDDLQGIEIAFQDKRIFAQNAGPNFFTQGENSTDLQALALLTDYHRWQIAVSDGSYTLSQGGTGVLSGMLRDYSAYTGLGQDAYRTRNFLFFGDNTSSAQANFAIDYAAITTTPVPEPHTHALMLAGLAAIAALVRRRRS